MSRVPIRLRLTLAFTLVMAVVLSAIGVAVYLRFESNLDATVDQSLRSREADLAAFVERSGPTLPARGRRGIVDSDESFAQVLAPDGRVLDATALLPRRPLLGPADLERARSRRVQLERRNVFESGNHVRISAAPVRGGRFVVVAGATLDDRDEALRNLRVLLLIGGPLALLLAAAAGYGVAAGALRPVEAMRGRAAAIGGGEAGERLPVPAGGDELSRLGETLNEMLERLEVALARERDFVADASHELRTPLAILRGELELALRSGRTREELEAALRSAAEETDRLSQLAEDLLLLARLDRGQVPLRRERLDATELLDTVGGRFARRAGDAGRSIEVDPAPGVSLEGDRLRLEQALSNMVENALRHGEGEVRLSARAHDGVVQLHVRDDGPGFPDGMGEHAFERFARGPGAHDGSGAGLGLAIVSAIAVSHGGRAAAGGNGSGGADVWMEIPLIVVSSQGVRVSA